jgi:hypothetical protein
MLNWNYGIMVIVWIFKYVRLYGDIIGIIVGWLWIGSFMMIVFNILMMVFCWFSLVELWVLYG